MEIYILNSEDTHRALEICDNFDCARNTEDKVLEYLAKDDVNHIAACMYHDRIVGVSFFYEVDPNTNKEEKLEIEQKMMFIYQLEVLPQFRRMGIATMIINEIKKMCIEKNIMKMFLFTNDENIPAKELYLKTAGKTVSNDKLTFEYDLSNK